MSDDIFGNGKAYERHMGRWSRLVAERFLAWLDVSNGLHWLDVGCGNGAFTEEIVARCAPAAVSAIDPSEGQLGFARMRSGPAMVDYRNAGALPGCSIENCRRCSRRDAKRFRRSSADVLARRSMFTLPSLAEYLRT